MNDLAMIYPMSFYTRNHLHKEYNQETGHRSPPAFLLQTMGAEIRARWGKGGRVGGDERGGAVGGHKEHKGGKDGRAQTSKATGISASLN